MGSAARNPGAAGHFVESVAPTRHFSLLVVHWAIGLNAVASSVVNETNQTWPSPAAPPLHAYKHNQLIERHGNPREEPAGGTTCACPPASPGSCAPFGHLLML